MTTLLHMIRAVGCALTGHDWRRGRICPACRKELPW